MIALKLLMNVAGALLLACAMGFPLYGLWLRIQVARKKAAGTEAFGYETVVEPEPIPWRRSAILAVIAVLPLLFIPASTSSSHSLTACRLSICTITCLPWEFSKRA